MILSIGPFSLAGWVTAIWSKSMLSLILVRIFQGLAVGVANTIPSIYIAEIAEPNLRGTLSGTFEVAWGIGNLYTLCLGPFISFDMYAFACIPLPIIFTMIWMFVPESPYFLLMTKKADGAKKVLKDLRDGEINEEFQDMQKAVMEQISNRGPWKALFCDKVERMAFVLLQIVSIAKYLSGITVIKHLALDMVSKWESFLPPEGMSILVAGLLIVIEVMSAFLSDWIGRKPLLLLSCFGCFIAHSMNGGYYYIHAKTSHKYSWILNIGMAMYCVFSDIGVGPLQHTLQSELFGARTRGIAAGITEGFGSFLSLLVIKLYSNVHSDSRLVFTFWFHGLISLVGGLLLSCLMYETAGKKIGQMMKIVML